MTKIKEARLKKGWSQVQAAAEIGVHLLTYQLWERGVGNPNDENRVKLQRVLGVGGEGRD